MRERPIRCFLVLLVLGITPAYAGKTVRLTYLLYPARDHPRVCGKDSPDTLAQPYKEGSPPRMRERRGGAALG